MTQNIWEERYQLSFEGELVIPPEEADKLRQHNSFVPAMEEIHRKNWSSALRLLEKVLEDKPESKYILFLKSWCMTRITEKELIPKLGNIEREMENEFRRGIFDEETYDKMIGMCNSSARFYTKAKDTLKHVLQIDPDFSEAKRFHKYMKKWQPKLIKSVEEVLASHFEMSILLNPREFEKFIAYLFKKIGYSVKVTSYAADFGADVIAERAGERIVVQVKKYVGSNVGAQEVQQTLGSMWKYKANKAILVTTTDFTENAIEQARGAPIELWNINTLRHVMKRHILTF